MPVNAGPGAPPVLVVMGVSGCGKTTIGQELAAALAVPFIEGDALHPPRNVALMKAGTPLTDDDRRGWLDALAARLAGAVAQGQGAVLSCSALKRRYRDQLRASAPGLRLVWLHGSATLLAQRLQARPAHDMPASLLQSQLDTLEPPGNDEGAVALDIAQPPEALVSQALRGHNLPREDAWLTKVVLFTGSDGRARFRDERLLLTEGKPAARLSQLLPSGGYQLRTSPPGFRSDFHCTQHPQWVVILGGQMEIGLQDGSSRVFLPGQHFYSADVLPAGAVFDAQVHGHCSRQLGQEPLATLFVRDVESSAAGD